MPVFVCTVCGHNGNTALSHYWQSGSEDKRCHVCIMAAGEADPYYEAPIWKKYPRFEKPHRKGEDIV